MTTVDLGAQSLREAFGTFPTGVVAVCGLDSTGTPVGMAVSTFVPVSLEPPLVGICLQQASRTWPVLRKMTTLGISVLGSEHRDVARQLAAREGDRFAGMTTSVTDRGAVHLAGSPTLFECALEQEFEAGDHVIAVLRVLTVDFEPEAQPLLFHRSRFAEVSSASA
ncbi:flavin reductase family protein [Dactylosporangium sp. CA-092794]|uniref:flavin reductase family protein n=1 Tax=Dactylosporangium sp. CA-092794 TaxID=3239929 RepID=UPI003D8E9407